MFRRLAIALRRAWVPTAFMFCVHAGGVLVGALMVNHGTPFALQYRDQLVARAHVQDPASLALASGHRLQAAAWDFSRNLLLGAIPSTVGGLAIGVPYLIAIHRGWVGGIVSVDGNHVSRLADPIERQYYLLTLVLQLIPYSLAGGAGVRLGLASLRRRQKSTADMDRPSPRGAPRCSADLRPCRAALRHRLPLGVSCALMRPGETGLPPSNNSMEALPVRSRDLRPIRPAATQAHPGVLYGWPRGLSRGRSAAEAGVASRMSGSNVPAEYVQLAFMIDRHFPGYVDAYFGPPELKTQVTEGAKLPLDALDDFAASLTESISTDPSLTPDRQAFLEEELRAMRTTIRILGGAAPDFVDEVRLLYGVTPAWVDERVFEEAHKSLNDILPGRQPLSHRVQDFRERSRVPVGLALSIIGGLAEQFRARTLAPVRPSP